MYFSILVNVVRVNISSQSFLSINPFFLRITASKDDFLGSMLRKRLFARKSVIEIENKERLSNHHSSVFVYFISFSMHHLNSAFGFV
jgi:hypothetical protein